MEINEGNISTIASMVWAGVISPILIYFGIQVDNVFGTAIVSAVILVCILIWSAINPNSLKIFGNSVDEEGGQ